jgi:hypothetical protein
MQCRLKIAQHLVINPYGARYSQYRVTKPRHVIKKLCAFSYAQRIQMGDNRIWQQKAVPGQKLNITHNRPA